MTAGGLLDVLPPERRAEVLQRARRRRFRRREVVFHEGDPADAAHLVMRGHLGVRSTTPLGDEGLIGLRGVGQVVGEMALVGPEPAPRSATAVAMDDVETLALHRHQFDRLVAEVPALGQWLLDLLAERLRETSAQLLDALYLPADQRVLRRLLDAAAVFGTPDVPLTQDDLASMAGTTRPTVNRVLRAVEEREHLTLRRGGVRIVDLDALRAKAGQVDDWG